MNFFCEICVECRGETYLRVDTESGEALQLIAPGHRQDGEVGEAGGILAVFLFLFINCFIQNILKFPP